MSWQLFDRLAGVTPPAPRVPGRRRRVVVGLVVAAVLAAVWIAPKAGSWANCGASNGDSIILAVRYGEPTTLECLAVTLNGGAS